MLNLYLKENLRWRVKLCWMKIPLLRKSPSVGVGDKTTAVKVFFGHIIVI